MDSSLKNTIKYHSIWKKGKKYYCKFWETSGDFCSAQITKSTYLYLKSRKIKIVNED